ncbi:site-2 protease family protein [Curtobacterium sp. 9128]|uniref:site-2 protease family protein n=1 Tax=Curtobacterium sp. 9128 TaxID=1793722 RepID=UPI001642DEBF|nr:site-2 protease family protein [Curtobacterium sp. 9128]
MPDRPLGWDVDVWLNPGVALRDGSLVRPGRPGLPVNEDAARVLGMLTEPVPLPYVAQRSARDTGVPRGAVERELDAFIRSLSTYGLVSVSSSFGRELLDRVLTVPARTLAMVTRPIEFGRLLRSSRAYAPSVGNVVRAVVEAHALIVWIIVVGGVIAAGSVSVLSPLPADAAWYRVAMVHLLSSSVGVTFLLSASAHELAHLLVARMCGVSGMLVVARRGAVAVSFTARSRLQEVVVGAAGPLAGLAVCGSALAVVFGLARWNVASVFADPVSIGSVGAIIVIAAGHLCASVPWAADGRLIFRRSA